MTAAMRGAMPDLWAFGLGLLTVAVTSAAVFDWLVARRRPLRRAETFQGRPAGVAPAPVTSHPGAATRPRLAFTWPAGRRPATRTLVRCGALVCVAVPLVLMVLNVRAGAGPLGGTVAVAPTVLPLTVGALVATTTAGWLVARGRVRRQSARVRAQVVEACEALASGLRAGLPPDRLLSRTAEDLPLLVPAASAAGLGSDVASVLRSIAATPGAERLAMLASAWDVARRSGAGLADVVSRIAAMVRADAGRRRQVEGALGGARSTARLFAVLPLLGIALGSGMDADPVGVLTRSVPGAWCLCLGTGLACLGLVWVELLADGAHR